MVRRSGRDSPNARAPLRSMARRTLATGRAVGAGPELPVARLLREGCRARAQVLLQPRRARGNPTTTARLARAVHPDTHRARSGGRRGANRRQADQAQLAPVCSRERPGRRRGPRRATRWTSHRAAEPGDSKGIRGRHRRPERCCHRVAEVAVLANGATPMTSVRRARVLVLAMALVVPACGPGTSVSVGVGVAYPGVGWAWPTPLGTGRARRWAASG